MKVAVDARTLQRTPLGGVARSTLGHLRVIRDEVDLTLLTDARWPAIDRDLVSDLPQVPLRAPSARGVAWLQLTAPRWLRSFDGPFHCPFYGLPYRQPVPMTATIHDLTFEQHPEWYSREQTAVFRMQARHAARTARHLLTPSAFTRDEVCERYGVPEARVSVARNLLDAACTAPPPPPPAFLAEQGVSGRYVTAMGGAWRRGVDLVAAAWPAVVKVAADVRLVIVGDPGVPEPPGTVVVTDIDDEAWRGLLAASALFCYPTRHEGFGYPALEACAVGTPVVCARVGALPEVLGDAAQWIDELSAEAVADGIVTLLGDTARRTELEALGRAHARVDHEAEVAVALRRAFEAAAG